MKESAEASERNAESIREAAQANEELRQKGDARTVKRRERRNAHKIGPFRFALVKILMPGKGY